METYTDNQKVSNYFFLLEAIRHVQNGRRITEDWMEEQKCRILLYREFWPDLSALNPELSDYNFRAYAAESESLLSGLCDEIREFKTFTVQTYHTLNTCLFRMSEMFDEDNEIADLLSSVKLS